MSHISAGGRIALVLAAALAVTAAGAGPVKQKKRPHAAHTVTKKAVSASSLVAEGKKVYAANGCAGCHAVSGSGGKSAPDLTHVAAEKTHTKAWLDEQVEDPKSHNPSSAMPAYAESIKGAKLKALTVYLSTLK